MAYASKAGRARTSATNPQAHAICDRCGFRYNLVDLKFQYDWAGAQLQNFRVLVCNRCYDTPQEQNRTIVLPPDPVPVQNARVELYTTYEEPIPAGGSNYGVPDGLDANAQAPLVAAQQWAQPIDVLSVVAHGSNVITVNTNTPHNLVTGAQISVQGLNDPNASGSYAVTVVNATQFLYQITATIMPSNLQTQNTRMITMNIGLPYGQATLTPLPPITADTGAFDMSSGDGTSYVIIQ